MSDKSNFKIPFALVWQEGAFTVGKDDRAIAKVCRFIPLNAEYLHASIGREHGDAVDVHPACITLMAGYPGQPFFAIVVDDMGIIAGRTFLRIVFTVVKVHPFITGREPDESA